MSELELVEEYTRTPLASKPVKVPHGISHFDTLEYLRFEAQSLLQLLSNLSDRNAESTELATAKEKLHSLVLAWDSVLDTFQQDRRGYEMRLQALKQMHSEEVKRHEQRRRDLEGRVEEVEKAWKDKEDAMQKEIVAIREHLEQGKEVWQAQMKLIENNMKSQEAARYKVETHYRDNFHDIEHELDEILHEYKAKKRGKGNFGDILPSLFSPNELNREQQKVLGDSEGLDFEELGKIPRLEGTEEGEKWDINLESEESSELSGRYLSQTAQVLYRKLRELQVCVGKYKREEGSEGSSHFTEGLDMQSMEKGFIASLSSGFRSESGELGRVAKDLKVDLAKAGLNKSFCGSQEKEQDRKEDMLMGLAGVVFGRPKASEFSAPGSEGIPQLPLTSFSQDHVLLHQLPKELLSPQGHDVQLEDLLQLDTSIKPSKPLADTLELSGLQRDPNRVRETVGSMSGTDLKELIKDVHMPPPSQTPYFDPPSEILLDNSISSGRGHDSMLEFFQESNKFQESRKIDFSEVSDIMVSEEIEGKHVTEELPSGRGRNVPKLPLHLVDKAPAVKAVSPSIDFEESAIAILREETPTQDPAKTPEKDSSNRKFSPHIREPRNPSPDSLSKPIDSTTSVAFRLNSLFDLAPPPPTKPDTSKSLIEEGKFVTLMPEKETLLSRRAKMNQEEIADEQVSVILPKLVDESGYHAPKASLSYEENPAFRPRAVPISMQRKLPLLPLKPEAPGKFNRGLSRGRALQPIHPNRVGVSKPASPSTILAPGQTDISTSHPPESKIRSESPSLFNKFRIRRFKESDRPALKLAHKLPSVLPQRPVAALHPQL